MIDKSDIKKVALLIETSTSYGRSLIRGIIQYANIANHWIFYSEPRGLFEKIPRLDRWELDGIIMRDTPENLKLMELNIPTIISLRYQDKISSVPNIIGNSKTIGKMAAKYFHEKGFKNFAFCGFDHFPWSSEREESFVNTIRPKDNVFVYKQRAKKFDYERELNSIAQWLLSLPKPIAIMTCNDVRGTHVLEACKIAQIRVPLEVAVLGVNNDDMICNAMSPPLSSIALNTHKAGQQAAICLEKMMNNNKIIDQNIVVEPEYVVTRRSTDILAIDNLEVATAIEFIKLNSRKFLQVNDVVAATGTNRRSLERHFRQLLNRTIHEEITRTRIDAISKMLIDTDLSILEIATRMEFNNVNHISRYFKAAKGLTPSEFRKTHVTR